MKTETLTFSVIRAPLIEDLTSGKYKLRTHCEPFDIAPENLAEAKRLWAQSIEEQGEGELKVVSVNFIHKGPGFVEPNYINIDGPTEIVTDQTIVETIFTVSSPFPFTLLLIVIAIAIVAILAIVFQEEIKKIVDALYDLAKEYPELGLLVLALLGFAAIGVRVPKEEKEKT